MLPLLLYFSTLLKINRCPVCYLRIDNHTVIANLVKKCICSLQDAFQNIRKYSVTLQRLFYSNKGGRVYALIPNLNDYEVIMKK